MNIKKDNRKIVLLLMLILQISIISCSKQVAKQVEHTYDRVENSNEIKSVPCYAKCLISDVYENDTIQYILYTGEYPVKNCIVEEKTKLVTEGSSLKWEKRKVEKNCLSENSEDCIIWCLVKDKRATIKKSEFKYTIVKDTSNCKDFEVRYELKKKLIKKGGFTEWREVVCDSKLTSELIHQIKNQLEEKGYNNKSNDDENFNLKNILSKFQQANQLPIGQYDLETLEKLGIEID